ncbi:MAG: hypothetical protein AVDCRST_MAG91-1940, partial [uncultured Sphingomonadaceae bacterium]
DDEQRIRAAAPHASRGAPPARCRDRGDDCRPRGRSIGARPAEEAQAASARRDRSR